MTLHKYLYVDPDTDMVVFRENGKILHIFADVLVDIYEELMDGSIVRPIRCKDCKFYWKNNRDSGGVVCLATPKDDAFCSEGERKDDD